MLQPTQSSVLINLSNQGNTCDVSKTNLLQFNFIVMLGLDYLNKEREEINTTNVSISINQKGELTLEGIDCDNLQDEKNIKIYSDKKVICSGD